MDRYDFHRIVSYIAFHLERNKTLEEIQALNQKRKDKFQAWEIAACYPIAQQACKNACLLQEEIRRRREACKAAVSAGKPQPQFPPLRICDIAGCKFPKGR